MEEVKIKAIVLKSADYKDKDKVITLYSVELGLVSCILKNCKGSNYKLKFAYNPFSLAEFEIFKTDELFFVKTASLIESFFNLTQDYSKYLVASNILELLLKTNKPLEPNGILFLNTLKALNIIQNEENVNLKVLLIKYILGTLKVNGFKLNFNKCSVCNLNFINKVYLNLQSGSLECGSCKEQYSVLIENKVFNLIKLINGKVITELLNIDEQESILNEALKILILNLEGRFNIKINIKNYLNL